MSAKREEKLQSQRANNEQMKRIVVRTPNWVGDAVMSLPALHQLRRVLPNAHITVASVAGSADIFIDAGFIDDVLIQKNRGLLSAFRHAREWRQRQFDVAILFPNAFGAAATALLARVPVRIGYATDRRGFLLTTSLLPPQWKEQRHESFYYLNIVAEVERLLLGSASSTEVEPHFALAVSDERKQNAREILVNHGARVERQLAIICPGSVNSRAKRWPAERYAVLADQLIANGFEVVLIGSAGELEVSEEVSRRCSSQPRILTGKTSVAEATAIIGIADILVTNDTGPAHVGAALQTPTLVIFGPTNPLTTYPFSATAEIIRHPPECAPCMLRDCPIDHRCMTAIFPDEVFQRAMSLVSERNVQIVR